MLFIDMEIGWVYQLVYSAEPLNDPRNLTICSLALSLGPLRFLECIGTHINAVLKYRSALSGSTVAMLPFIFEAIFRAA